MSTTKDPVVAVHREYNQDCEVLILFADGRAASCVDSTWKKGIHFSAYEQYEHFVQLKPDSVNYKMFLNGALEAGVL